MKQSSPLVWLCAVCAVALAALALIDPTGIYKEYVKQLDEGSPAIAAVFTAAQDGVFPWTKPSAPAPSPAIHTLNETVTDAEMRSSVGNESPFNTPEPYYPDADSVPAYVNPPAPSTDSGNSSSASDEPGFVTVDTSWFDDAVFIGDSHIEGFSDYAGLPNATYYYKRGLDIWSVLEKPFVEGKLTVPQALLKHHFGKIYLMLGINEIECGTTESYAQQYASVVDQIRALQPDALIYIQAIFHTSKAKSESSVFKNEIINARNEALSALADGEHVFFIDCNPVFDDTDHTLTAAYTGDGVHVMAPYYSLWRDYLLQFGRPEEKEIQNEAQKTLDTEVYHVVR